ncbi:MAG TPA: hypothetical protein VFL67_12310 [Mycobacterium sp.]|nr:hypothetical protein [Mycobacterium sp.]
MGTGRRYDRPSPSKKPLLGIAAVVVMVAVSISWLHRWVGWHVSECGFDSQGLPYAVVRDNTIGGAKREQIAVQFGYNHLWDENKVPAASSVRLPTVFGHAIGGVTTVIHGTWPKRQPNGPQNVSCTLGSPGTNDYSHGWFG